MTAELTLAGRAYIDARATTFESEVLRRLQAEARALLAGASPEVAAKVCTYIGADGKERDIRPRKVAPFLTEDRTVAVNAQGKSLPHNARGCVAPGSGTLRGKDKARQRTRAYTERHATTIDAIRRDCEELRRIIAQAEGASYKKRKALRGAYMAVSKRIEARAV